jgi:hypothetical protein
MALICHVHCYSKFIITRQTVAEPHTHELCIALMCRDEGGFTDFVQKLGTNIFIRFSIANGICVHDGDKI